MFQQQQTMMNTLLASVQSPTNLHPRPMIPAETNATNPLLYEGHHQLVYAKQQDEWQSSLNRSHPKQQQFTRQEMMKKKEEYTRMLQNDQQQYNPSGILYSNTTQVKQLLPKK